MSDVTGLRWMAGIVSGLAGAMMLIVPHQFSNPSYALIAPQIAWWGIAFLLSGLGLLAASVLQLRRPVLIALHLFVGATWGFLGLGFLLAESWIGVVPWAVFGLGIAVAPFLSEHLSEQGNDLLVPGRPDLLSLLGGLTVTLIGLVTNAMLATNQLGNAVYSQIRAALQIEGIALASAGTLLLVATLPRLARIRPLYLGAHLLAGGLMLAYGVGLSLQVRAWTGILIYAGIGLSLVLVPLLQNRLRSLAHNSLPVRMSVFVSIALTVSLVLAATLAANYAFGRAGSLGEEDIRSLREATLGVLLLSLAVAVAAVAYTARWVGAPLRDLAGAASKLAGGDRAARLPESDIQEVQDLVASFAEMRGRLAAREAENARLHEQQQQLAIVEERQRIARELHDSVTQGLYAVTLYSEAATLHLESGDLGTLSEQLREIQSISQQALREMRLLIFELRPPVLEKEGLVAALQARLDSVEGRGGVVSSLKVEGEPRLTRLVEEELYRIAQEALNNVLKHSRAKHVAIALEFGDDWICLEVSDDGVGFEPSALTGSGTGVGKGGLGLKGMAERARQVEGHLSVESAPSKGTRVRIEVPSGQSPLEGT